MFEIMKIAKTNDKLLKKIFRNFYISIEINLKLKASFQNMILTQK